MLIREVEATHAGDHPLDLLPPAASTRDCADITGILIDRLRRPDVLTRIDQFVQTRRPHQIVTVNADFLSIANREADFIELLNQAAISVPDGMPLIWLSRLLGQTLPERITGTDLLLDCAALAAARGYRIFLLGAAPGVADEVAQHLTRRFPGLQIAGTHSPPYFEGSDPAAEAAMVALVRAAQPDMLFVAMGTPKQERWIYNNLDALGVPVCIGVGGVFNFITGRIPRAPQLLQHLGLEWFFRLVLEPRRLWRRYLVDDTRALAQALAYSRRQAVARRRRAAVHAVPAPATPPGPHAASAPHLPGAAGLADNVDWPFVPHDVGGPVVPSHSVDVAS
jgi:N-acetylglucosaminyldiphosphoundecaprenol N-acetyl-beta-D-mannosaminyltransferase